MKPYFSILLPTKNRPKLIRDSVLSVLLQNFDDYELIISDNNTNDLTKNNISDLLQNNHIKYYKTNTELSMPDNWENALNKASGKYIMVLPDRKILYKDALKTIYKKTQKYNQPDCCSWCVKVYNEQEKHMGWFSPHVKTNKTILFKPNELIENFLEEPYLSEKSKDFYMPKSLNGCFKKELWDKAKDITDNFFNNKYTTTPDYSSCFIQLALSENVLYINKPIYLSQGESVSNGRHSYSIDCMPYLKTLSCANYYKFVPIKAPFIYNLLINDFLTIKNIIGGNLKTHNINWIKYYSYLKIDLENIIKIGLMSDENLNIYKFEYNTNINTLKINEQSEVNKLILKLKNSKPNIPIFKNICLHLKDYINHNHTHINLVNKVMKFRFENTLKAAGFSAQNK